MTTNKPEYHWEPPRICCICTHYHRHYCTITAAPRQPEDPACTRYTPKKTD